MDAEGDGDMQKTQKDGLSPGFRPFHVQPEQKDMQAGHQRHRQRPSARVQRADGKGQEIGSNGKEKPAISVQNTIFHSCFTGQGIQCAGFQIGEQ